MIACTDHQVIELLDRGPWSVVAVPWEAIKYFRSKRVTPSFDRYSVWREEHARAFTLAGVTNKSFLEDVKGSLEQALHNGDTFETWRKSIKPAMDKAGWTNYAEEKPPRRLETIYDTNMRQSAAAGQWQRIERTKQALPYLKYELGPSKVRCEACKEWAGIILPVGHEFWSTRMPPNHFGCKCRVRQISKREAEALGGVTEDPPMDMAEVVNPKTGDVEEAPRGMDPNWAYNPGADYGRSVGQ